MLSPQGPPWSRHSVARMRRHNDRPPSGMYIVSIWQICEDKELLSFINGKMEWESPPSIFVIRNPN